MNGAICPFAFAREFWPRTVFYDKQVEVVESVERDDETFVVAVMEVNYA